jgi:UDP-glucose 4-epimerase
LELAADRCVGFIFGTPDAFGGVLDLPAPVGDALHGGFRVEPPPRFNYVAIPMNVFVTGGAGYIGSICVEELLNAGHAVTVYDNLSEGHRSAVDSRATFILGKPEQEGDILNAVKSTKPDAIMHFAANALVGESMKNPKKYFQNNVVNALELADAAVESGVQKFVFSSTCATYGPPDRMPMTEDLPQRPINPYGESKLMFEKILRWYQQIYGLEFVAFRYFNAAGASERFGEHHRVETHLIPNVLKVPLGQSKQCEIYGTDYPTPDGTCIRDYIHIVDLAQAHILGLAPGARGFYNLGNGDGYSVRQVISTCERVTGKKIPTVEKPRRPGDPPKLVASAEKAIRELGWKPKFPKLEDIAATAWLWHKKNPNGYPD